MAAVQGGSQEPVGHRIRPRGEEVRRFILESVEKAPKEIAQVVSAHFGITRQASNKHLKRLVEEGALVAEGKTRERAYRLAALMESGKTYPISGLEEYEVWLHDVAPVLGNLSRNVLDIWQFCVTEIVNNAIDHSGATEISLRVAKTASNTQVLVADNGVGIFRKIHTALGLADERQAVLELAKGKLTTDPAAHTGQGIFFTSRLLDSFDILSGSVFFTHTFGNEEDWILERPHTDIGTYVFMKLNNHSARIDKQVFDQYSSGEDYGFTKTVVPVRLAQYGDDKLVSRSQAKRLLARVDRFKTVIFDFKGVESIGRAFADEIFRVFASSHPAIEIESANANTDVQQIINAARSNWGQDIGGV